MRSRRAAALLAALLVVGAAGPAAPAEGDAAAPPAGFDLGAAQRALERAPVHRAPGAVAEFDAERVLPELDEGTRVLLAPPYPGTGSEHYDAVYGPMADWAREAYLDLERDEPYDLVLVTGTHVQLLSEGSVVFDGLDEAQRVLAHRDVTEALRFAVRTFAGAEPADDSEPDASRVPADPALVEQVVTGLRGSRAWVAPGATADAPTDDELAELLPDLPVRVAFLPVLGRTEPYPDLLPELARAFPDELVVLMRGTWLEARAAEGQREVRSSQNYVLGAFAELLERRDPPPHAVLRLFLERLQEVRFGQAFRRPPVAPVAAEELLDRWLRPTAVGVAGVLLLAGIGAARRRRAEGLAAGARASDGEQVAVLARLNRLGERLVRDAGRPSDPARARAAERHATAAGLLEQARRTGDSEVLRTADAALADAERELAGAVG